MAAMGRLGSALGWGLEPSRVKGRLRYDIPVSVKNRRALRDAIMEVEKMVLYPELRDAIQMKRCRATSEWYSVLSEIWVEAILTGGVFNFEDAVHDLERAVRVGEKLR